MAIPVNGGFLLMAGESTQDIIKISSDSPYKSLKRQHKIVCRRCSDVILELDEDYAAAAFAVTDYKKKNEGIVYSPTLVRLPRIMSTKLEIGYIVARKDGMYFYSYDALRELLLKSERPKGGLQFLSGWKEERELQRKSIDDMILEFKSGKYG